MTKSMIRLLGSYHEFDIDRVAHACPLDLEFYVDGIKQDYVISADEVTGELVKQLHRAGEPINSLCICGDAFVEVVMRGKVEVRAAESIRVGDNAQKPRIIRSEALDGTVREAEIPIGTRARGAA